MAAAAAAARAVHERAESLICSVTIFVLVLPPQAALTLPSLLTSPAGYPMIDALPPLLLMAPAVPRDQARQLTHGGQAVRTQTQPRQVQQQLCVGPDDGPHVGSTQAATCVHDSSVDCAGPTLPPWGIA